MGIDVDFSKLIAKFEKMEKKAQKDLAKQCLEKGSDIILDAQKSTVPVKTGALLESLDKGNMSGGGTSAKVNVGIENGNEDTVRYGFHDKPLYMVTYIENWENVSENGVV